MAHIPLIAGLSAVEQARLLGKLERVNVPQHSFIFMQNDPGDCMYILSKGQVEVFVSTEGGNQSVGTIGEGETFGEINLLLGQPRSATVMATTDVELFMIGQDVFDRLINEHASIANYFTRLLSNRLIKTNESLTEYKHVQHNLAAAALARLPEHLRRIALYSLYLPNPSLQLLGEHYEEDDLAGQLAGFDTDGQLFTIRDGRLEWSATSLEMARSTLAGETDSMELEHFVLSFVDLYMQNSLLNDAVMLLLRNQLWQEACLLFDRILGESEAGEAPEVDADLLDKCPNEVLFADQFEKVLFHYLNVKLERDARQGFAKTEAMLQESDDRLSERVKLRLYEYLIAFCDRLGFEQKALEYVQVLSGLQQTAAGSANAASMNAPAERRRRLGLAKLQIENENKLRQVGDAYARTKRGAVVAIPTLAAVAVIIGLFAWLTPPPGLDRGGMLFIGITVSAMVLWMVNIMPDYLVSLLMCMAWVLTGLTESAIALSGFSNPIWLYIILVLLLGAAMASSGLMYRLSLHLMRIFPKSYRGQLLGIAVAGLALNPLLPSGMTKVMLATPLSTSTADALGFAKRGRGTAGLVLAGLLFFGYATPFFLTAGIGNFLALGLIPDYHVSFVEWAWYALPAFLLFVVFVLIGLLLLFRAEPVRRTVTDELVKEQLGMLGPITSAEKALIGALVWIVGLQLLQPLHGIAGVWIMLTGVAALILLRVLDKPILKQSLDFTVLLHLGVAIGFSAVATELGVADWLSEKLLILLEPFTFSPYVFLPALVVMIFALSFFVYSTPAMMLLIVALLPLFENLAISPWILIFIVLLTVDPFLLPYQSEVYLAAYYGSNGDGFSHSQGRKAGLLYCGVTLLLIICSIPFWQAIGLIQ